MAARGSEELHQALIRDHFRQPRNRRALGEPSASGRAHNRFCGDTVRIWARVAGGRLTEVTFDGRGCAISQAAASMLTSVANGKDVDAIRELRRTFLAAIESDAAPPKALGDLRALTGVGRFPSRIRCAVLPFDALEEALASGDSGRASEASGTGSSD